MGDYVIPPLLFGDCAERNPSPSIKIVSLHCKTMQVTVPRSSEIFCAVYTASIPELPQVFRTGLVDTVTHIFL